MALTRRLFLSLPAILGLAGGSSAAPADPSPAPPVTPPIRPTTVPFPVGPFSVDQVLVTARCDVEKGDLLYLGPRGAAKYNPLIHGQRAWGKALYATRRPVRVENHDPLAGELGEITVIPPPPPGQVHVAVALGTYGIPGDYEARAVVNSCEQPWRHHLACGPWGVA
jgi:hypothetical protein